MAGADPGELGPSTAGAAAASPSPSSAPAPAGRDAPRPDQPSPARPTHDSYEARRAAQDQRNRERAATGVRRDEAPTPAAPAPPPVAADGERRIKVGDAEFPEAEVRAAMESKAARAAGRPADPNGYELRLPADFEAPPGVEVKFATDDPFLGPILQQARDFAHRNDFTQEQFSGMLALRAAEQAHEQNIIRGAFAAENAKLGVNASARVEQVRTWLGAMAGPKAAGLVRVLELAPVADTIDALETLMQKFHSQAAAPNGSGRDRGSADGRIPGYAMMTFEQRAAQDRQRLGHG